MNTNKFVKTFRSRDRSALFAVVRTSYGYTVVRYSAETLAAPIKVDDVERGEDALGAQAQAEQIAFEKAREAQR